jgi:large subunit ribosomal protein L21
MYAVIKSGGKQHRVTPGEKVRLEKLDADVGSNVTFDQVLLLKTDGGLKIGAPVVSGATVAAKVVEHGRAKKVVAYTYKRRKNHARKVGHRQHFTTVEIVGIAG